MMALWALLLIACLAGTSLASRRAVGAALRVTETSRMTPAAVGLTVMAIGTDLPEIANSIVSVQAGHGDINVGDSMGSVLTQITLTLGVLLLVCGAVPTDRNFIIAIGTATFFAVVAVRVMLSDGDLSHVDGLILIAMWAGGSALLGHQQLAPQPSAADATANLAGAVVEALAWLAVVGVMAVGVVESFIRLAAALGLPEFIGSFVILAIGTSLPELFVDWTAIRRGVASMAMADVFGSSFVDATLSIGIGPALFSSDVSGAVSIGTVVVAGGVVAATVLVARSSRHGRRLALALLAVYVSAQTATILLT